MTFETDSKEDSEPPERVLVCDRERQVHIVVRPRCGLRSIAGEEDSFYIQGTLRPCDDVGQLLVGELHDRL